MVRAGAASFTMLPSGEPLGAAMPAIGMHDLVEAVDWLTTHTLLFYLPFFSFLS